MSIDIRSILVVEDEPDHQKNLEDILVGDAHIECVATVEDAYRILNERGTQFDLMLLDIHLTDGTGIQLLDRLEENQVQYPCTVMVTVYNDIRYKQLAFCNHNVVGYIVKPFLPNDIFSMLQVIQDSSNSVQYVRSRGWKKQLSRMITMRFYHLLKQKNIQTDDENPKNDINEIINDGYVDDIERALLHLLLMDTGECAKPCRRPVIRIVGDRVEQRIIDIASRFSSDCQLVDVGQVEPLRKNLHSVDVLLCQNTATFNASEFIQFVSNNEQQMDFNFPAPRIPVTLGVIQDGQDVAVNQLLQAGASGVIHDQLSNEDIEGMIHYSWIQRHVRHELERLFQIFMDHQDIFIVQYSKLQDYLSKKTDREFFMWEIYQFFRQYIHHDFPPYLDVPSHYREGSELLSLIWRIKYLSRDEVLVT